MLRFDIMSANFLISNPIRLKNRYTENNKVNIIEIMIEQLGDHEGEKCFITPDR